MDKNEIIKYEDKRHAYKGKYEGLTKYETTDKTISDIKHDL